MLAVVHGTAKVGGWLLPYNRNPRNQKRGDCIKSLGSQLTLPADIQRTNENSSKDTKITFKSQVMIYFNFVADSNGKTFIFNRRTSTFIEKPMDMSIADLYHDEYKDFKIHFKPDLETVTKQARIDGYDEKSISLYTLTDPKEIK